MTVPGKISYLLGGDTRKQVAADLGGKLGLTAGTIGGALLAKNHLMQVSDALCDLSAKDVQKSIQNMPGKWGITKALGAILSKASLIQALPQSLKAKALLGGGLLLGTPLLGYTGGALTGHYLSDPA
jgi:hypothetical protein